MLGDGRESELERRFCGVLETDGMRDIGGFDIGGFTMKEIGGFGLVEFNIGGLSICAVISGSDLENFNIGRAMRDIGRSSSELITNYISMR